MTDEPRAAGVRFDDNRLVLEQYRDRASIYYSFPGAAPDSFRADGRTAEGTSATLSLTEALHARIRPSSRRRTSCARGRRELPRRTRPPWTTRRQPNRPGPRRRDRHPRPADATDPPSPGTTAATQIPGGSIKGRTTRRWRRSANSGGAGPARNGRFRSGPDLAGRHPGPLLTMEADGEVGEPETLNHSGGAPAGYRSPSCPPALWPRRLSWRIAHWHAYQLAGVSGRTGGYGLDLDAACGW